jgi:hypothetical protein
LQALHNIFTKLSVLVGVVEKKDSALFFSELTVPMFGPFLRWTITADLMLMGILPSNFVHVQCGSATGLKLVLPTVSKVTTKLANYKTYLLLLDI